MGFKLAVTGGRNYTDKESLFKVLDKVNNKRNVTLLIHGNAKGADSLACMWAKIRKIPQIAFDADWSMYGKSAGPIRNREMLDIGKPDGVVAFPGGRGTADMVKQSKIRQIEVYMPFG